MRWSSYSQLPGYTSSVPALHYVATCICKRVVQLPEVMYSADTDTSLKWNILCHFVNVVCSELPVAVLLTVLLTFHLGCLLRLVCVAGTPGCCIVFRLHAFWMMLLSLYTVSAAVLQCAGFHTRNKLIHSCGFVSCEMWCCVTGRVLPDGLVDGSRCRFNVVRFLCNHVLYIYIYIYICKLTPICCTTFLFLCECFDMFRP